MLLESLPYWGSGKDEDITRLSPGWEARVTPEGRVFFVKYEKTLDPIKSLKCFV